MFIRRAKQSCDYQLWLIMWVHEGPVKLTVSVESFVQLLNKE